jgi:acyl-CoA thioester hydrolase
MKNNILVANTIVQVRFNEVDSMGIVWHGNYFKYFEDGREDFGKRYGISYLDFRNRGILVPIVKVLCDYKKPLIYGDSVTIETKFINCEAAKIQLNYIIYNNKNQDIIATGSSVQVFLNLNRELLLDFPPFFADWRRQNGL